MIILGARSRKSLSVVSVFQERVSRERVVYFKHRRVDHSFTHESTGCA